MCLSFNTAELHLDTTVTIREISENAYLEFTLMRYCALHDGSRLHPKLNFSFIQKISLHLVYASLRSLTSCSGCVLLTVDYEL